MCILRFDFFVQKSFNKAYKDTRKFAYIITRDHFNYSDTSLFRFQINIRNFQCSMCGKTFLRKIALNTHMKYHLNIKTKQCPHCPMVFVETKNLNRHLKTHVSMKLVLYSVLFVIYCYLLDPGKAVCLFHLWQKICQQLQCAAARTITYRSKCLSKVQVHSNRLQVSLRQ